MRRKLRIGDKVIANKKYPYKWDQEEIRPGKTYTVTEEHFSKCSHGLPYVQLKGVHSSYPEKALTKVSA